MDKKETIVSAAALVIHPFLKKEKGGSRSPEHQLEEAKSLALAIDLEVMGAFLAPLQSVQAATYIGSGKVAELAQFIRTHDVQLVVMDCQLSPGQQRNLEKEWSAKVIDRTALILEIFGARARTREGVLQVELAALEYQKSRLVRSWTHLERQRGGFGFIGGPGETQIEVDRRMIRDRIAKIKRELEKVKNTRALHRKSREAVPYPIVALVGYTNAGKSTLFNRVTGEEVLAKDMLFATLDPTMRVLALPSGQKVILSDTVGFISELPTQLVAAFRATLEEVIEADLILHVRDIASPDTEAQKTDVEHVLRGLGLEDKMRDQMLEVWNKIDLLERPMKPGAKDGHMIAISALKDQGTAQLLHAIDERIGAENATISALIPASEGKLLAWVHAHGKNIREAFLEDQVRVTTTLSPKDVERLKKMGGDALTFLEEA